MASKRLHMNVTDDDAAKIESRRGDDTATLQVHRYIQIGEWVYTTLDRGDKIMVQAADGTSHEAVFLIL